MVRKYINYIIFAAIVLLVVGLAVSHSRHMSGLVRDMSGADRDRRIASARELVKGEQFMDSITGESTRTRVAIVGALEDWAASGEPNVKDTVDPTKVFGAKDAVKQLVAFLKDPDKPVRDRIVLALVSVGTLTADNLTELVNGIKDGDANARKASVATLQALGQLDEMEAMARLKRALPDTKEPELRAALAKRKADVAQGIIGSVVKLMKADAGARGTGGDVLGNLRSREARLDQSEACVAALLPLLMEKDEGVRSGAVSALGKVASKTPAGELVRMMKEDTKQIRRVAIGSLALIADPSCETALLEALRNNDDDNEARAQAAVGLGRIGSPAAIAAVVTALSDYDLKVQLAAVSALARAGRPAIAPVSACLSNSDAVVRRRAADALGRMTEPSANGGLIRGLTDASPEVRLTAAQGLGFGGNAGGVTPLAGLLNDPNGAIADAAATSLAAIGAPARPALMAALSGPESGAFLAARALGRQGGEAVADIRGALATRPAAGRWLVQSLAAIGGPEAGSALHEIEQRGDPTARTLAAQEIKRLGL